MLPNNLEIEAEDALNELNQFAVLLKLKAITEDMLIDYLLNKKVRFWKQSFNKQSDRWIEVLGTPDHPIFKQGKIYCRHVRPSVIKRVIASLPSV